MDLSSFDVRVFGPGFSQWNAQKAGSLNPQESDVFTQAINGMGQLSSKAQELSSVLTTAEKLRENTDTIFVICDQTGRAMHGLLRLGRKHLFLYPDNDGSMFEEDVLCLLDFYVHESVQRKGVGLELFSSALKREGISPIEIAYDRPSPKLKPFLAKHFGLQKCIDQPNRFMVFKEFFGRSAGNSKQAG